jgi:hypothetical protein
MSRTIEDLEGEAWGEPEFGSHVVTNAYRLRKKPIDQFSVEDLRFMIGQGIGIPFLLPRALGILESNPLVEGDFYPGDLLENVLGIPDDYWCEHEDHRRRARRALMAAESFLQEREAEARRRREQQPAWLGHASPYKPGPEERHLAHLLQGVRAFLSGSCL